MDAYVKTAVIDGVSVVTGEGELDAYSADALRTALIESCGTPAARVVIDLSNVPFIDSTALGVLVGGLRRVREVDGELLVVLPRGAARKVFEITTLDRALPTAASRHEAIEALTA
jgi:anti-sigma B factor antagonist